jgi:hypothetical protein
MFREHAGIRVTELVEERRRPFDVREQKRDCAGRQGSHDGMIERSPEKV